jgi:hypothetical protein
VRAGEPGELDRGDPDAGRGRVDEEVLARVSSPSTISAWYAACMRQTLQAAGRTGETRR